MTIVTMPQLGESVTEGTILQWLKHPGDQVAVDEALCEIETEKVTAELPSPFRGVMGEAFAREGETVEVGARLCEIVEAAVPEPAPSSGWSGGPMAIPPEEHRPTPERATTDDEPTPSTAGDGARYSPAVLRLAQEHGIDLAAVPGTGAGGRVTRKDVEARLEDGARPVPESRPKQGDGYDVVPLSRTRRTIAEHMERAHEEVPQAWMMVEVDVTAMMAWRESQQECFAREEEVELTLLAPFTAEVCAALREHPLLNSRWEGPELRRYEAMNIGIAVATDQGLMVPVIHNAGEKDVAELARNIADLARRARTGKLRIDDIQRGTFTVNNTGAFGSIVSNPIVNYPQIAIVTMERAQRRPVVVHGDAIAVRWMMNVCLSFDHRALDGADVGAFLGSLKQRIEKAAFA